MAPAHSDGLNPITSFIDAVRVLIVVAFAPLAVRTYGRKG
jgi:hypothetical protein